MSPSADPADEIVIKRQALLDFYDQKPKKRASSPVSAITGLLGEECVLQLIRRHLKGKILDFPCKTRGQKGPRLDGWIDKGPSRYQVEVKNWCSHSVGVGPVPSGRDAQLKHAAVNLDYFLTHPRNIKAVWKVLAPMNQVELPSERKTTPLLAFWAPVARAGATELSPLFRCPLAPYRKWIRKAGYKPQRGIHAVWIFSASLYLRKLRSPTIRLPMPNTASRLKVLTELIEIPS